MARSPVPVFMIACLAAILAACSTAPVRSPERTAMTDALEQARRQFLMSLHDWALTGRIAVHNESENWNATLRWTQQQDAYALRLMGPLGQGAVQLEGGGDGVMMRLADGQTFTAQDAEALLRERLGWNMPVAGLRYWVLGLADPRFEAGKELDEAGRPLWLEQSGWRVEFSRYAPVNGVDLPHKLALNNPHLQVRLVIDRWELAP
ncbi:MAG: lipoprotein insertase outer membrane protein LolB [Pseudomonadota bacterium]